MKRGTLVLMPFPFSDLSGQKLRPALVVSRSDRSDADVILAFISTQLSHFSPDTDLLLETSYPDFKKIGLKKNSVVKLDKLVSIEDSVIIGELGDISLSLIEEINRKLGYALELK